jgi:hypothetical protein
VTCAQRAAQVGEFLRQLVTWGRTSRNNGWHTRPSCVGWVAQHGVTPFDVSVAAASAPVSPDQSAQKDASGDLHAGALLELCGACPVAAHASIDEALVAQRTGSAGSASSAGSMTGATDALKAPSAARHFSQTGESLDNGGGGAAAAAAAAAATSTCEVATGRGCMTSAVHAQRGCQIFSQPPSEPDRARSCGVCGVQPSGVIWEAKSLALEGAPSAGTQSLPAHKQ